jgi:hypothetical protein
METTTTFNEILDLVQLLSPVEKVRLIERIAPQLERDLQKAHGIPRTSLRGLWHGLEITSEDITEIRREMWERFPREDI